MPDAIPAVSVIIPAWGVAHLVGEALASLQTQTFTEWEAIVVDDGAPDDVAGAVAPYAERDPRIRFFATPHGGPSVARNHGIAIARAPLIAMLDGDDMLLPRHLEHMVAAINAAPDIGLVSCDAIYQGQRSREGRRFSEYHTQAAEPTLDAVLTRDFNVFVATLLRKEAVEAVGGFDATVPTCEDLDLWIRILEAGWRGAAVREPLAIYRRRPGSLSTAILKMHRADIIIYQRATERLAGRPEAATAARMIEATRQLAAWTEGEDLVIAGQTTAGLRLLRAAGAWRRSPRWRVMMGLFRAIPLLARPVLAWRRRQAEI